MKLFKIIQTPKEDQCAAARCKNKPEGVTKVYPGEENTSIHLCRRHIEELLKWLEKHSTNECQLDLTDAEGEKVYQATVEEEHAAKSTSIVVSNVATALGAVQSVAERAEIAYGAAEAFSIENQEAYTVADEFVALLHEEEKALKKEKDSAKKPLREAGKVIDDWFRVPLDFYKKAKELLKDRMGDYRNEQNAKCKAAQEVGNHEEAQACVVDDSDHTRVKIKYEYAVLDKDALPALFLFPEESKADEIAEIVIAAGRRDLLRPNYDLIRTLVDECGTQIEIPGIEVIKTEEVQMKGGPKCRAA